MNKAELVDAVSVQTGLDKRQAESSVNAFIGAVMGEARAGNKVSIFGFGIFTPNSRAARTGRNPQTGAPVKIAASKGVRFAPASAFKGALNTKGSAKKATPAKAASAKAGAAKKATAKKATAKKATAKKATAKKATAKAPTKKASPAKKAASAKKAPAKAAKATKSAKK